jgi:hypothetical protein
LIDINHDRAANGDLRLVNPRREDNWVSGPLQVFYDGHWGEVCNGIFGAADAAVACKQLGYSSGTVGYRFRPETPANEIGRKRANNATDPRDPVYNAKPSLALVGCRGNETKLTDCPLDTDVGAFLARDFFNVRGVDCDTDDDEERAMTLSCIDGASADPGVNAL